MRDKNRFTESLILNHTSEFEKDDVTGPESFTVNEKISLCPTYNRKLILQVFSTFLPDTVILSIYLFLLFQLTPVALR